MPIVIVAAFVTLLMIRLLFAKELSAIPVDPQAIENLDAEEALKDRKIARRVMFMLGIAVILFIFQEKI